MKIKEGKFYRIKHGTVVKIVYEFKLPMTIHNPDFCFLGICQTTERKEYYNSEGHVLSHWPEDMKYDIVEEVSDDEMNAIYGE